MDKIAKAIRMLEHGKAPTYVYKTLRCDKSWMSKEIREAIGDKPVTLYRRALARNPEYRVGLTPKAIDNLRQDFPEDFTIGWDNMKWNT